MTERNTVLITGASSGIGRALALLVAEAGSNLVLVARRRGRLETLAQEARERGAEVEVLGADLSEDAGIDIVAGRLLAGGVDVLVNNAGAGGYAPLAAVDPGEVRRLWTLNATAPLLLVRAALPHLLQRNAGGIINVASLLAFSAGQRAPYLPARTIYASAKAAGVALTRTLAGELAHTDVQVTLVCPGRVRTEFSNGAAKEDPEAMSAEDVAAAAWLAFGRREAVCIPAAEDAHVLDELAIAERVVLESGNRPLLAARYTR